MLQNVYLRNYHFAEKHSIDIMATPQEIWPMIDKMDFSGSPIIKFLFTLRGMPAKMMRSDGLEEGRFIRLDKKENEEIIIGLIGQFWRPNGNLQKFDPSQFVLFDIPGYTKGTWSFTLTATGNHETKLETETRVFCTDDKALTKFNSYWFFIKMFSGIIRKEILRGIKKKVELQVMNGS
jgi:hypothetical protein